MKIGKHLASPVTLTEDFSKLKDGKKFGKGSSWRRGKILSILGKFKESLLAPFKVDGYSVVLMARLEALYGNNGESLPVLKREIKLD